MRLVKTNSLAPSPCLYLFSIKSYRQKTYITMTHCDVIRPEYVFAHNYIKVKNLQNQKFQNRKFRDSQKFPWFIASSTIYCFHEFTWFFCKLLDIKERSAVWPLENAGGYNSLIFACRAPILAQSSSACQTTLSTRFQIFIKYEGVNFINFWSICPGMPLVLTTGFCRLKPSGKKIRVAKSGKK